MKYDVIGLGNPLIDINMSVDWLSHGLRHSPYQFRCAKRLVTTRHIAVPWHAAWALIAHEKLAAADGSWH